MSVDADRVAALRRALDERCLQTGLGKKLSSTMIDIFGTLRGCVPAIGRKLRTFGNTHRTCSTPKLTVACSRMFCRSAWTLGARTCAAPIADTVDSLNTSIQSWRIAAFLMSI